VPPIDKIISKPLPASSDVSSGTHGQFEEAVALHRQGRLPQAQAIYKAILEAHPRHHDALHLLGVAAYQDGNYQIAADLIDRAIELNPDNAAYYCNRGNALQEQRRFPAAVADYDKAIAIKPDYALAHCNRGNALKAMKQFHAAVASYDQAIGVNPNFAEAHSYRGTALRELKQLDAAVASYDRAIAIKPDYAEAHGDRGNVLRELKHMDAAVASYDRAIAIKPDYAEAFYNRGNALKETAQLDAAVASYDRAIAINPDYAEACFNRGNALKEKALLNAAVASYDQAIAIKPDYVTACWNRSLALLLNGELERGWEAYEWRWEEPDHKKFLRGFIRPLWLGESSLHGKTILLHGEQGLGDTIQFCRYSPLVAAQGARVIIEVPKALVAIMQGLDGVSRVVEHGKALPAFDYHCPMLSLPLALKTRLETIPNSVPYLHGDKGRIELWKSRLGVQTRPRIGLAWSGSMAHKNDRDRSIALSLMLPYLPSNFEYVSLQREVRDVDIPALQASQIRHYGDEINDFADTAALCELMDVVVGVDTSAAHLSGALGRPTWILLPHIPDWRWMLGRDDSPWYPSAKLYRRGRDVDWAEVLDRVKSDLLLLGC
jgi:tetratricopeptide (TPR) repeat protein